MNGSELDYCLGSWHARWDGGEGTNTITREFDGKVVVECFEGRPSMELTGYSVSVYDAEADLWRQTWVDDQGSYFAPHGRQRRRHLRASHVEVRGAVPVELRMVFREIEADSLRWLREQSKDGGATRDPAWEIAYTRTT